MKTKTGQRDISLRHTVATLAYRAAKPLRRTPAEFSSFRVAAGSRSAGEILAHMCDLLDWVLSQARASSAGATPNHAHGARTAIGSLQPLPRSMTTWLQVRPCTPTLKGCFKALWPML